MLQQFIQRPILSFVIAILITLVGVLSLMVLPVSQYPDVVPPTVQVTAYYPGASAEVVQKTVAVPLEEQINGVEDMMYMTSQCGNDGSCNITVYFEVGTDPDMATVNTQNRAQRAFNVLPAAVTQGGVIVMKRNPSILMLYALTAEDTTYNFEFLSNYAQINIVNTLKRIEGVGDVSLLGGDDYAMRIWLNPDRMAGLSITTEDVTNAIQDQNVEAAAGAIGKNPAVPGQELSYIIRAEGRLKSIEEFNNIVIKTKIDGSIVRMKDVARTELGLKTYDVRTRYNKKSSPFIAVYQAPGSNATQIREDCNNTMALLASQFPPGLSYEVGLDTVEFVDASVHDVMKTLLEAFILVFIVVFIFLQDWRATLIPAVTVPVSLIGALAAFTLFGFSINMLTLFALVLAIGIVVDDAIVVLEAVQEKIDEHGMSPLEATKETMKEIAPAILTITLVLSAVFIPVSFLGGTTGQMYKQFALTLTSSIIISGVLALTLSPAMCVLLLKPKPERKGLIGKFFNGFDKGFLYTTNKYMSIVNSFLHHISRPIIFLAVATIMVIVVMKYLPSGFLPEEDQGYFFVNVISPKGVSLAMTDDIMREIEDILEESPGVQSFSAVPGYSILDGTVSTTSGAVFVKLQPWDERTNDSLKVQSIIARLQQKLNKIQKGICMAFNAPAISGLGTTGGLELQLEDKVGADLDKLAEVTGKFAYAAMQNKVLGNVYTGFRVDIPQYFLIVNKDKAKTMGVPVSQIYGTLQAQFGSLYVNDYNQFGKSYRVIIQADALYRSNPEDINLIYVRSTRGEMVPLGTLVSLVPIQGPDVVRRFNLYSSSSFTISPAAGYSSGQAIEAVAEVAKETLPFGFGYEYSGLTRQELIAGNQAPYVFALCFVFVFLLLAAKYESWFLPLPILLAMPFGIFGALGLQWLSGLQNNIYAQIGLIMLIGLVAKNAILIVEFARQKHEEGMDLIEASKAAAKLRFRPILMTSFAFILGVVPLVLAGGAGAASRHALGTSVFGGMLLATICGVMVIPALYVMFQRLEDWTKGKRRKR
ncbi:MAG: multidrug efflux RND transporter permease subunit [Bacteroidales bacterium]|nr:multidrug efflux RND transporter permease subunit [Bacteroidales bacterium]